MLRKYLLFLALAVFLISSAPRMAALAPEPSHPPAVPDLVEADAAASPPAPAPEPPAPPPAPPATPSAADDPRAALVCNWDTPAAQRLDALQAIVRDFVEGQIDQWPNPKATDLPCITAVRDQQDGTVLATGRYVGKGGGTLVLAWQQEGQWRVAGTTATTLNDWFNLLEGGRKDGRPSVLFVSGTFTGGNKQLLHVSIDESGALHLVEGPRFHRSGVRYIQDGLILAHHRTGLWYDMFPTACEACMPMGEETLVRWDGRQFEVVASRIQPSPEVALNVLRVALQRADLETARRYVALPTLLTQIGPLLKPPTNGYVRYAGCHEVDELEERNWNALPPALQTPLPDELRSCSMTLTGPAGSATIHMERHDQDWVVSAVEPAGAIRSTAHLAETSAALRSLAEAAGFEKTLAAGNEATTLLELFLPTDEAYGITGQGSAQPLRDDRLPGVAFFLTPADGVRVVELRADGGRSRWAWVQWWESGTPKLQTLGIPFLDRVEEAQLLDGPTGRYLVVRMKSISRDMVGVYRLDPAAHRWIAVSEAVAQVPPKVRSIAVDYEGTLAVSWDDKAGTTLRLLEDGLVLEVCSGSTTPCVTARWNGTQYTLP